MVYFMKTTPCQAFQKNIYENGRIKSLKLLSASYENLFLKMACDFQNSHKLSHSKITRYTVASDRSV